MFTGIELEPMGIAWIGFDLRVTASLRQKES
jgi:hypothetical protein